MFLDFLLYALGFIGCGIIFAAPVAYKLGRRAAFRECDPAWDHINELHQLLGHKSYIILRPQIGARRLK